MNSMTGYGFKEVIQDSTQISVEIKSVNNRFLDLNVNMPSYLNPVESRIREEVTKRAVRGKIDLSIRIRELNSSAKVSVDTSAARMYFDAMKTVASSLGMKDDSVSLSLIVNQDGVLNITHEYDAEAMWLKISPVLEEVLNQFVADRIREGENLKKDLLEKLDVLDSCAEFFAMWQPKMEEKFKEQITSRFNELLGDHADENRIMTEVAAMLVKYTINEEIIRLKSHLEALRKEITSSPVPGKRLDFICQEANREINTIGSKNQFAEVGAMVVNAKDALENIREQSKNVE